MPIRRRNFAAMRSTIARLTLILRQHHRHLAAHAVAEHGGAMQAMVVDKSRHIASHSAISHRIPPRRLPMIAHIQAKNRPRNHQPLSHATPIRISTEQPMQNEQRPPPRHPIPPKMQRRRALAWIRLGGHVNAWGRGEVPQQYKWGVAFGFWLLAFGFWLLAFDVGF